MLNLAVAGHADFIVTRDLDLLDLMTDDSDTAMQIRKLLPELRIVKPEDFLAIHRETLRADKS